MWKGSLVAFILGSLVQVPPSYSPARYRAGALPIAPITAVGGGEVFVELAISREGRVAGVTRLRTTPPFTDALVESVRGWRFSPAEEQKPPESGRTGQPPARTRVASSVLVAAVFRAPALMAPTLGERPRDVAAPSDDVAFPLTTLMPPFPPMARDNGIVLLEVRVDPTGAVADVAVIGSAPPFDDAARTAARQWRFRPARVRGLPASTFAYILFGFRAPIGSPTRVPRAPSF